VKAFSKHSYDKGLVSTAACIGTVNVLKAGICCMMCKTPVRATQISLLLRPASTSL
jgi:hypothetical protein